MEQAQRVLEGSNVRRRVNVLKTEYPERDLCIGRRPKSWLLQGARLGAWANHRGIAREQVMAIGDNYNDIEMLEYAGVPVIMGNASEELRGRNWKVTLPNSASGVAAAIEEVVFEAHRSRIRYHSPPLAHGLLAPRDRVTEGRKWGKLEVAAVSQSDELLSARLRLLVNAIIFMHWNCIAQDEVSASVRRGPAPPGFRLCRRDCRAA